MTRSGRQNESLIRSVLVLLFLVSSIQIRAGNRPKTVVLHEIARIEFINAISCANSQNNNESFIIPLKRTGRLFLIEASVDGVTGNFVFDSGADKMVLNKTYFRNNLFISQEAGGGLTGTSQPIYITQVKKVVASGFVIENQAADVTELGQIENRRKTKILGLIGMSLFSNMAMEIDLRNGMLRLTRLDKTGAPANDSLYSSPCDYIGKIHLIRKIMFLKGTVGGKALDFCLDTGAESNVLSRTAPKKVMETISINSRSELSGMGGADTEVLFGTMNDFCLGNLKFRPMQTIVASLTSLSQAYDYPVSGILGFDFFDQGIICINLVTKEIRITLHEKGGVWEQK
jgi:predicted aspartyl protease